MTDAPGPQLDGGTYEVVRQRLEAQGGDLRLATDALNRRRQELFGSAATALTATERVRTEHACIPRDLVAVGDRLLLGYQVRLGLKSITAISDVFAELRFDGERIVPATAELLGGAAFEKDFREIFQYYKDARLAQLRRVDGKVLAAFQTGSRLTDLRVLRWAIVSGTDGAESLKYLDNRGDADYGFPPRHDFAWARATREMHVHGQHPHVNVLDTVFVECINGDLTIKVENNTASGAGIISEPVAEATQGLDDAEILYAKLDNLVLLRIRPYREDAYRHFVYNALTRDAVRIDAIGDACQQLPEGHGLIFPGGYYLATGAWKVFPVEAGGMEFERAVRAPNGEDILYVYYDRDRAQYVLSRYNLVAREVEQPMAVNGHCLLDDGRMVVFRAEPEPQRLHALQVWRTPFSSDLHAARQPVAQDTALGRIGNRELVRGVSDLLHLHRLIDAQKPTREAYLELLKHLQRTLDSYHWLGDPDAGGVRVPLLAVQATAGAVLDEFEKVEQLTAQAAGRISALETEAETVLRQALYGTKEGIDAHVAPLTALRKLRGAVETARGIRYADGARIDALDARLSKAAGERSAATATFLLEGQALAPYLSELAQLETTGNAIAIVAESTPIVARLDALAAGLDLLVEIVNGLDLPDATARTGILERIGTVYAALNRARAVTDARRRGLGASEARAGFGAAFALLTQAAANAMGLCDTPAACDDQLARLMLAVEELESRYSDLEEFAEDIATKRSEIYDGFSARKQALLDERQRRADGLVRAADRVLTSVSKRALACATLDELNTVFASDAMVVKLRQLVAELRDLGASVAADDVDGRLKSTRDGAVRQLRDKSELYTDGGLRLGKHAFSVNAQAIDVTLVPRGDQLCFHVTGTDYEAPVEDAAFAGTKRFWSQDLPSEDATVYRGEFLAWSIARAAERHEAGLDPQALRAAALDEAALLTLVQRFAAERYDEGYERGTHDADAVRILIALLHLRETGGLLRYPAAVRALALLAWDGLDARETWQRQCRNLAELRRVFAHAPADDAVAADLSRVIGSFAQQHGLTADPLALAQAGCYLRDELCAAEPAFAHSAEAGDLGTRFLEHLRQSGSRDALLDDLRALRGEPAACWRLLVAWLTRFVALHAPGAEPVIPEVAADLLIDGRVPRRAVSGRVVVVVDGLLGRHARIVDRKLELRLDDVEARLDRFAREIVPAWRAYQESRRVLVAAERDRLRLGELKPKVLTSFVRNRLVDEVYLPLIGDNLAKQMGSLGATRRTDQMGMLLLISPPGYGKTTLMEYLASVLGLAFVKVNGPALGHEVTSVDPAAAPNAAARQELEKLNLAFALGNNVMLVIDDIQHCNPEFLQKFISLCDGQRRVEGVWRGAARTYDLRGKKFVVVMAGNPYTESGERFRIPDMLANRADTWNLGDILGGAREAFESSYVENCLVVNPVLRPVATRPHADIRRLLRLAAGDDGARGELEHPYTAVELTEVVSVLKKLLSIRDALVAVNGAYIASAAQADAYRAEPPFRLQGSYRNMAKLAERVVPVMDDAELRRLLLDHYRQESQTLTTGAEANLLKLKLLLGAQDADDAKRWADITRIYTRRQELDGKDDPASIAALQLAKINERLDGLRQAVVDAAQTEQTTRAEQRSHEADSRAHASEGRARESAQLATFLSRLGETLDTLGRIQATPPPPPPKVEIINTLPKYYARLYQHHVQVIEQSLIPVIEAIGQHLGQTATTRQNLQAIAGDLRGWLKAQSKSDVIDLAGEADEEEPPASAKGGAAN